MRAFLLMLTTLFCLVDCRAEAEFSKDLERIGFLFGMMRQGRVVDQGPVRCYDDGGFEFDCPLDLFPGQDGQYIGVPKPRSISAAMQSSGGDLISRDYGTGLVWTSCPLDGTGAPITNALCAGAYGSFNQADARGHCSALNQRSYGGMTGWRLPSIRELLSLAIFDPSKYDQAAFPGPQATLNFISDTTRGGNELSFDVNNFATGSTPTGNIRCVSGVPLRTGNFRVISGSSVLDMDTGLVFTRCSAGQNDPDCTGSPASMTWQAALQYCDSLSKDGRQWRLPALHEMMVLFQIDDSLPFDYLAFPNAPVGYYWTSTSHPTNATRALEIDVSTGLSPVGTDNKINSYYARCVSGP